MRHPKRVTARPVMRDAGTRSGRSRRFVARGPLGITLVEQSLSASNFSSPSVAARRFD